MTLDALPPPQEALAARYGAGPAPAPGPWNETIALMLAHRSVRAYVPGPLPEGLLETLLAAGQSAATSSNMQSWSVVAVADPAQKARLAALSQDQAYVRDCALFLCFVADTSRARRLAAREGLELPSLACLETFLTAATDCAFAAQNMALAAESLGLGCCYIGALRNRPEAVAAELGLPEGAAPVFGLCIGHEDPARITAVKPRLPQSVVLHHGRYDADDADAVAAYDATLAAHGHGTGRSSKAWAARVHDRLSNPAYLNGRERLREALGALGFPLR
ncbi:NADPH-dependent oxidoreductase [Albimonas pacifica]|uniref:Nitroreductase n=1 Tax=Albimonas pacifica TaxID=1114924 RepID=A0A1I3BNU2_9RHOB|nr:NADPH-dependent oxidoreductase [Albimonas pacifica]SFH63968.1 Nitroreductase [Albimonas pacifica]